MGPVWYITALLAVTVSASSDKLFPPVLPIGALNFLDRQHFLDVFSGFNKSSVREAHYAFLGNSVFGRDVVDGVTCGNLTSYFDSPDIEIQYYAISAARGIESCTPRLSKPNIFKEILKDEKLTVDQLYYIVSIANIVEMSLDKAVVLKLLNSFVPKATGPSGLSTILATAAMIRGATEKELDEFYPLVTKLVEQGDEVEGNILFFERGAYTTAFALESIFRFAAALKKSPNLTEQQLIKFTNFLYERRRAHQIRTAARVASAFDVLATNAFMNPVVVYGVSPSERAGVSGISVSPSRRLHIRLFDVFGTRVDAAISIQAGSLYAVNGTDLSKPIKALNIGEFRHDETTDAFEIDLSAKNEYIPRGRYALEITVTPIQKIPSKGMLVGVTKAMIPLRVISPLRVGKAHIKTSEASKVLVDSFLTFPESHYSETIRLYHSCHLHLAFTLEDGAGVSQPSSPPPHQVFVQLTHATHQSVTYITKRSTADGTYTFTMILDTVAEDFGHFSGVYKLEILVGDALIESPIVWHVADVDLRFPLNEGLLPGSSQMVPEDVARLTVPSASARKRAIHPLIGSVPTTVKPLLEHTFRAPEPRPSDSIAYAFTALCCIPLFILILAWPLLGANLTEFPYSISALLFHLGLGGIFGLYLVYWFKMDMFTTLRYLFFLGVFTFVTGNRLLRQMVNKRHKTQE